MSEATVSATVTVNAREVGLHLRSRVYREYLEELGELITAVAKPYSGRDTGDLVESMGYDVEDATQIGQHGRRVFASTEVKGALVLTLGSFGRPQQARTDNTDPNRVPYAIYNWQGWTDKAGNYHQGTQPYERACDALGIHLHNPESI